MNCNCQLRNFEPNDLGIIGAVNTLARYDAVNENGINYSAVQEALLNASNDNEVAEISSAYDEVYKAQIGNFGAVINVISSVLGIFTGNKSNNCPQCPPPQMTTNYLPLILSGAAGLIVSLLLFKKSK